MRLLIRRHYVGGNNKAMNITQQNILQWLENCHTLFNLHQDELTQLDREIGDADHGLNMQRGFSKVAEKLQSVADKDIGTIFKTVGMTLLSQVGGASGPLFGTFFLKAAMVTKDKMELTPEILLEALQAGTQGVIMRGRAERNDKTMCDVLLPVLDDFQQALTKGENGPQLFAYLAQQAAQYAKDTIPLIARKGRASYLNERSIGHQDPGATSVSYIFLALAQALEA